jgi:hypothetical protein
VRVTPQLSFEQRKESGMKRAFYVSAMFSFALLLPGPAWAQTAQPLNPQQHGGVGRPPSGGRPHHMHHVHPVRMHHHPYQPINPHHPGGVGRMHPPRQK